MKSVRQQIGAMARRWPTFEVAEQSTTHALWFGGLIGVERSHRLSLEFALPDHRDGKGMSARFPVVRVLSPRLILKPNTAEEAPLPHVYFEEPDTTLSPLCLFDPSKSEWSHDDLVAHTTVPWAADWLACYEGWLATGRWHGGGRHGRGAHKDTMEE
ncbi:MAG: hypothetical protein COT28_11900 [Methylobacterium sp. CG08_land_8_20_14_0_20_71_15]|uniref:Type II CBASS E2 protein domain-containing protein n=2 Tax=Pseudomonadota TaxID=1224 RepID=A0ABQ4ST73_9HYPH|nr:MAG: hypothetical protein COT56_04760 [Methylobacterium sp. CG09_land_8_20_14_0_10_71_15]PIU13323.1 MAG: hypothetical protein COT28_11900 [Methylobacterium sp. CG08_land_8_20_14_0_20_71_15]GBU17765.1 hypothetical protein AwMethylo_19800 [Methylobacterium sp.]GJE06405.1 hypothetical protein AOPFMNJM_1722 [Methylobacterium jeotgali]